jgi:transcriptional regulator with XRE-family HTH domain
MWFDDMDIGGRGICQPAKGPMGRAVRAARNDLLLSQQRVADIVGVSQSAISRLERGGGTWHLFSAVMEALGARPEISVTRILSEREELERYATDDGWW